MSISACVSLSVYVFLYDQVSLCLCLDVWLSVVACTCVATQGVQTNLSLRYRPSITFWDKDSIEGKEDEGKEEQENEEDGEEKDEEEQNDEEKKR